MDLVLHIVGRGDWDPDDEYRPDSLDGEGFVHCSDPDQVVGVADARYAGRDDLELLCLDVERLDPEVRYEALGDVEEPYPHVYGPVNPEAVVDVVPFSAGDDGFSLPQRVRELADE
jgi:uncharacterized protein (DUF952 family)